ncbi:hypothetical protein Vafri_14157 [Volvox africanus]|uniref:Uncharacterized protein n=1 Tax=Volvox africanus TaxID=51714 RepID=A0A8J4F6K5_9CHLO|nr:hypothetical protein Vafri_14157 [Volvox africanus]
MPATVSTPVATPSINVHLTVPTMDGQLCNNTETPYNIQLAEYILRLSPSPPSPGTGPIATILIGVDYLGTLPVLDGGEDNPERIFQTLKCSPITITGQTSEDGKCPPQRQVKLQLMPIYSPSPIQSPSAKGDTDAPCNSSCGSCISSQSNASTGTGPIANSSSSSSSRFEAALSSPLPPLTFKIGCTEADEPECGSSCPPTQSNQYNGGPEVRALHTAGNSASDGRCTSYRPRPLVRRPSLPLLSNVDGHLPLEYEALMEADMDDLLAHDLIHWTPEQLVEDALERALKTVKNVKNVKNVKTTPQGLIRARSKASVVPQALGKQPLAAARAVEAGKVSGGRKSRKHKRSLMKRLMWGLFGACSGCSVNAL